VKRERAPRGAKLTRKPDYRGAGAAPLPAAIRCPVPRPRKRRSGARFPDLLPLEGTTM
jgi:hypothetical protein